MRVAIVGAGAVGCVLGGLLARAGHDVRFLARGGTLRALRGDGVHLETPAEPMVVRDARASDDARALGAQDVVLVAVKAWQVEPLAPTLAPLVGGATLVVPLQNGVEAPARLAAALPPERVVGGLCHVLATREAVDRVRYVGNPPQVTLGERSGGPSARLEAFAEALRAAGIVATVTSDVDAALFAKLLFVEPFGAVGAAARASIDVVRSTPETRALLEGAMREVQAVASARGVRLPDDVVTKSLARVDAAPVGATASMHRDLVEGRPSELDEQTGAVVRLARAAGVACPLHETLYACLVTQDARLRSHRGAG